jgi:hypothetical protein
MRNVTDVHNLSDFALKQVELLCFNKQIHLPFWLRYPIALNECNAYIYIDQLSLSLTIYFLPKVYLMVSITVFLP